jgi:hypothetical protein
MRVVHFIQTYAEERGLPQYAAPRWLDNIPSVYLTFDTTKTSKKYMHQLSNQSCSHLPERTLEFTSFKDMWHTCLFHIRVASPKDDDCASREKLRRQVLVYSDRRRDTSNKEITVGPRTSCALCYSGTEQ